jgi:hypothetical protein
MRPRRSPSGAGRWARVITAMTVTTLLAAGGVASAGAADLSATGRVDLAKPRFSHPTRITNPLFPARRLTQLLQFGAEQGEKSRFETTRLSRTKVIRWNGRDVRTVVDQFVAYTGGRIAEVAVDYYAQADDGSVWYFGENVDNYANGRIENHDGTWLAGRDGPAGMIMPAHPRVGDVFRPENIPGLVLEIATVTATNLTVTGPRGRVPGAVRVRNLELDGSIEEKIFAPRYGEFQASVASSGEFYQAALAVPTDSLCRPVPRKLVAITAGAGKVFRLAAHPNWRQLSRLTRDLNKAWSIHKRQVRVPPRLAGQLTDALRAMDGAVAAHKASAVGQAALNVDLAGVDLQSQYRSVKATDKARAAVWRHQLQLDRRAAKPALVAGDKAVLAAIAARR